MSETTGRDDFNLAEAFNLARESMKMLLAINGGAVVALLTFYGQALGRGGALPALERNCLANAMGLFAAGAAVVALTTFLAYVVQYLYGANHPRESEATAHRIALAVHAIAVLLAITSVGLFVAGVVWTRWALLA